MSSFSMDKRSKSSSPLVSSLINNRLFKTAAPDIGELSLQFIHTMHVSPVADINCCTYSSETVRCAGKKIT